MKFFFVEAAHIADNLNKLKTGLWGGKDVSNPVGQAHLLFRSGISGSGYCHQKNKSVKTPDDLFAILLKCWCRETAYPGSQKDYDYENDPTYGQCAITATLFHDIFGGTIHKIRVNGGGTHYFNKLNGRYFDLTRDQFDLYNLPVEYEPNQEINREYCGKNQDTQKRYSLLKQRIVDCLVEKKTKNEKVVSI